ncbi:hypothetical protein BKA82DRAFT_215771 [Pisolithus tinctorius]|uniref:Secreted protein n=1 Tax=Pisolithus tinctorius Marx 270 TaxID=870435 RepID=A0A0C3JL77_PISTI|nr:hypothetical protein BKA82DRAFT_215771 [Pisolithus tinctorius]KIO09863.1 hypothetical protein M404DRAFT_215771 [Pisolithus tinctorius Marx 270]
MPKSPLCPVLSLLCLASLVLTISSSRRRCSVSSSASTWRCISLILLAHSARPESLVAPSVGADGGEGGSDSAEAADIGAAMGSAVLI